MFLFLTRDSFAPLAFALVFLLTSCVHFHPKPLSAEVGAATLSERSLNDPHLRAVSNASSGKAHASWGFDQLVIAALYFNPQLNESRSRSAVAAAGKITAGERPNPTLSFAPESVTRTTIFPWVLGGSFDVPIETAGKRRFRLAQAQNLWDAARLNIATTAWRVRSGVRKTSYCTLYRLPKEAV